jgi:hypothetical protein
VFQYPKAHQFDRVTIAARFGDQHVVLAQRLQRLRKPAAVACRSFSAPLRSRLKREARTRRQSRLRSAGDPVHTQAHRP